MPADAGSGPRKTRTLHHCGPLAKRKMLKHSRKMAKNRMRESPRGSASGWVSDGALSAVPLRQVLDQITGCEAQPEFAAPATPSRGTTRSHQGCTVGSNCPDMCRNRKAQLQPHQPWQPQQRPRL